MKITAEMIQECRRKMQGVIVSNPDGGALVRSAIHYDGHDELYDGSG